jgi:hypothetical protein
VVENNNNPVVINITVNVDSANQLLTELILALTILIQQYAEAKEVENKRVGKI